MKPSRILLVYLFSLTLFTNSYSQVVINEFSCANTSTIANNFFQYEDWIELYNTGSSSIDLNGYYLSDKVNNPTKWQVPSSVNIPANGFIMVYADKKNLVSGNNLHTNFKLTQTKQEYIILSDPSGTIIDSIQIVSSTRPNHSRGRTSDGSSTWSLFTNPSPGWGNSNPSLDYVSKPIFDIPAGFYMGSITITITSPDPATTIHYTVNGNFPDDSDPVYTAPINITATTVLKAIAYSNLGSNVIPESFIECNTYFMDEFHVVPVISISGGQVDNLLNGNQSSPIGYFEYFDYNQGLLDEAQGEFNKHGNDSWWYQHRGVDYITRDQFGYNHAIQNQIFRSKDRDKYQRLILKAAANDNYPFENGAHIRDAYVHSLSQVGDLRMDERTFEPCVLYVNGLYWGVYDIREKVDDLDFTDYYYDQDEGNVDFIKTWGGTWIEYGTDTGWTNISNYILSNDMTVQSNYDHVKQYYNTGSLIDYFILNSYVVCSDWLNWNTAWWRGTDPAGDKKKWRYALWDMDATFDHYINYTGVPSTNPNADPCDPETLGNPGGQDHVPIWNRLLDNDEFFADYINRYADLSNTVFSCDFMRTHLDSLYLLFEPEMQGQINRWGGNYAGWVNAVTQLENFIDTRCAMIFSGIEDCYEPEISGPYDITILIDPPLSGEVDVNSIEPASFPWTGTYFGGIDIELDADAYTGWEFDYWEPLLHTVNPGILDEEVKIELTQSDTVIAHFRIIDTTEYATLTILVNPALSGNVQVNDSLLNFYAWSDSFAIGNTISLTAFPEITINSEFDYWELQNHTVIPTINDEFVNFSLNENDTIIAHFVIIEDPPPPPPEPSAITTPNAFTPNEDGDNDMFFPVFINIDPSGFSLSIFNRWGELAFHTEDIDSKGWDGIMNGQKAPEGVYVYKLIANFNDGKKHEEKSILFLLR